MTTQTAFARSSLVLTAPTRVMDGAGVLLRGLQRLLGVSLMLAAVLLWVAPGATWESDILLFKLVLTLTGLMAGIGFLTNTVAVDTPDVEIDVSRREVRLVSRARGEVTTLKTCSFGRLSKVERTGPVLRLWDESGAFLAEVTMMDEAMLKDLVHGLKDEGKLA